MAYSFGGYSSGTGAGSSYGSGSRYSGSQDFSTGSSQRGSWDTGSGASRGQPPPYSRDPDPFSRSRSSGLSGSSSGATPSGYGPIGSSSLGYGYDTGSKPSGDAPLSSSRDKFNVESGYLSNRRGAVGAIDALAGRDRMSSTTSTANQPPAYTPYGQQPSGSSTFGAQPTPASRDFFKPPQPSAPPAAASAAGGGEKSEFEKIKEQLKRDAQNLAKKTSLAGIPEAPARSQPQAQAPPGYGYDPRYGLDPRAAPTPSQRSSLLDQPRTTASPRSTNFGGAAVMGQPGVSASSGLGGSTRPGLYDPQPARRDEFTRRPEPSANALRDDYLRRHEQSREDLLREREDLLKKYDQAALRDDYLQRRDQSPRSAAASALMRDEQFRRHERDVSPLSRDDRRRDQSPLSDWQRERSRDRDLNFLKGGVGGEERSKSSLFGVSPRRAEDPLRKSQEERDALLNMEKYRQMALSGISGPPNASAAASKGHPSHGHVAGSALSSPHSSHSAHSPHSPHATKPPHAPVPAAKPGATLPAAHPTLTAGHTGTQHQSSSILTAPTPTSTSTLDSLRRSALYEDSLHRTAATAGPAQLTTADGPLPAQGYLDEDVLHLPPTSAPRFELELGGDTELTLLERAARTLASWSVRVAPDRSLPLEVDEEEEDGNEEEGDDEEAEGGRSKGPLALTVFWNDSAFSLERIRSLRLRLHSERLNHIPAIAPLADPVRLVQLHTRLSEADKGALADLYAYIPRSFVLPEEATKLQRWLEDLRDAGERRFLIWKPLEPKSLTE